MGLGGRGGRSSGRSYGGGSGANMGAVAGASRLFKSDPVSLSSSESIDYSKWDEEEIKLLNRYSKESRCRMAASCLDGCEEIRSPGHPRCNRYRVLLADCPGGEKGKRVVMGLRGRGGRSSGRSYGGGSGANMGAVAGASRLFKSDPASLSSSESIDYSKWDEEEIKWLNKYSKESRCRMAASFLDVCEEIRSPGHPRCNRYRVVLADCPGGEKGFGKR